MNAFSLKTSTAKFLYSCWQQAERKLVEVVEYLNPILIKETRQALKSRQFVLTFMVTLLACWIASFAVFGIVGPEVFFVASGNRMLYVYCAILAFPLMLVVPYSAYRSIATEQEDNTYDLLSITSLTARQIIAGKLGSAVVQMLVYLCAVSPCIAFTFLLRGVDLLLVAILLALYFIVSLGESMIALLLGTMARVRHAQALSTVLLVIASGSCFLFAVSQSYTLIDRSDSIIRENGFWIGIAMFLTLFVTSFLLLQAAAAAQLAFHSENRSTPLRKYMLVQQACFLGWVAILASIENSLSDHLQLAMALVGLFAIYWYLMGSVMTSEWPHLSRRVQRDLPQSRVGQIFLTWFNPGPGTGFMFAIANFTAIVAMAMLLPLSHTSVPFRNVGFVQTSYFLLFAWCYLVIFLGLGSFLIALLRRYFFVSMTAGFLFQIILLLLGCGVPQVLTLASDSFGRGDIYSLLHSSNPIWTLIEAADNSMFASTTEAQFLMYVLPSMAAVVLLLNLRSVAAELLLRRRNLPTRVVEEEAELRPAALPAPASPWDLAEQTE